MINNNEKVEKLEIKPVLKRLNFRILVAQLTEAYKLKVCLGEQPNEIFDISEASNEYLIRLIKNDVKTKLPIEQKSNWLTIIKNKISKFKI